MSRSLSRWSEAAPELTGRTDGNKRVVFPEDSVMNRLDVCRGISRETPNVSLVEVGQSNVLTQVGPGFLHLKYELGTVNSESGEGVSTPVGALMEI